MNVYVNWGCQNDKQITNLACVLSFVYLLLLYSIAKISKKEKEGYSLYIDDFCMGPTHIV